MDVRDVVALVSGGASGLGEACVRRLVAAGAKVAILDRDVARGEALIAELGEATLFCEADVTETATIERAIERAEALGPVRVALSCAGIGIGARTVNRDGAPHDLDAFERVIRVNLLGTFNLLRLAAAAMARHEPVAGERGVIVNTASVAAFDGQVGQVAYSASKGGVVGLTLPAARDLSKVLVRVVTIAPGSFDTPMLGKMPDEAREHLAAAIPHPRRLGAPEEFSALALHIIENAYLNGEVIRLDGALRMAPR